MRFETIGSEVFDDFVRSYEGERTFLQGVKYGSFRKEMGEGIFLKGIFDGDRLIGVGLIQKIEARRGTYLHVPHGPLLVGTIGEKNWNQLAVFFLESYIDLGKEVGADFVRMAPLWGEKEDFVFSEQKFRSAPVHLVNPEKTWVLDITPSEEDLLKQMKKSTRYEVRRIEKMGIEVKMGNGKKDLDCFWELHEETVARQGFVPFSRESTEKELKVYGDDCQIFTAFVEGKPMSSSVILFDDRAGYYHQGASRYSKLPVAHATLWEAIKEGKSRGCREFNFWGVCDVEQKKHPWWGLSRFKRGFGGEERNFIHCQDFPLTGKYWLSWGVEKYRRWKRGY